MEDWHQTGNDGKFWGKEKIKENCLLILNPGRKFKTFMLEAVQF